MRSMIAAALLLAAPAHADDDLVARPLVLAPGALELRLTVELGVDRRQIAPISIAPDAWLGIAPRWTIGVIHSSSSLDQIDAGATLCVRDGPGAPCRLYRGSGIDVRFAAREGALAVAPRARLVLRDLDPAKPAVTLGALVRWARGRFSIASDPFLRLPLANHDRGNRAALSVPLWLAVQPARGWMIALHTGFDADLIVLRDGSHGPFALAVTARITCDIDVSLEAGWQRLLGPQYDAKHGAVALAVGWHR